MHKENRNGELISSKRFLQGVLEAMVGDTGVMVEEGEDSGYSVETFMYEIKSITFMYETKPIKHGLFILFYLFFRPQCLK